MWGVKKLSEERAKPGGIRTENWALLESSRLQERTEEDNGTMVEENRDVPLKVAEWSVLYIKYYN